MRVTLEIFQALFQRVRRRMRRGVRLRDASFRGETGFVPGVSAEDLPGFLEAMDFSRFPQLRVENPLVQTDT